MASLRKRPRSKNWFACITLPDGRKRQFSTGTDNHDDALAIAQAAESSTRRHHDRPQALRASLARLIEEFAPTEMAAAVPATWIRQWAERRKTEVAAGTAEAYSITAEEVALWFEDRRVRSFEAITEADCRALRDQWREKNSGVTANKKLKHLKLIFNAAVRARLLAANPAEEVPTVTQAKTVRREFSEIEMAKLLKRLDDKDEMSREWRAMVWLGLNTGQRLNDLAVLPARAIDLEAGTVTFHAAKTGALVSLPLLDKTIKVLKALPRPLAPMLPVFPGVSKLARPSRSNAFREILESVHLARPMAKWKRPKKGEVREKSTKRETSELSFHSLRHTATTWLKSAGVADSIARAIIGHESVAVSRSYTHLDMQTMREAMAKVEKFRA
jgi:integrase